MKRYLLNFPMLLALLIAFSCSKENNTTEPKDDHMFKSIGNENNPYDQTGIDFYNALNSFSIYDFSNDETGFEEWKTQVMAVYSPTTIYPELEEE